MNISENYGKLCKIFEKHENIYQRIEKLGKQTKPRTITEKHGKNMRTHGAALNSIDLLVKIWNVWKNMQSLKSIKPHKP